MLALLCRVALTAGGWLGGTIVFVHGMRVEAARKTSNGVESRRDPGAP